jgi:uridine kinase
MRCISEEMNQPYIISISAVSGGGKTTIAKQLTKILSKSKVLSFDDYDFNGPEDIIGWVDRGADYEEWDLTSLTRDIEMLREDSFKYIILDYPFSRKHTQVGRLINLAIFIDTPLDVALARRINRDFQQKTNEEILQEMQYYISHGRKGYLEMLSSIKPNSDVIFDGSQPVQVIVDGINNVIKQLNNEES